MSQATPPLRGLQYVFTLLLVLGGCAQNSRSSAQSSGDAKTPVPAGSGVVRPGIDVLLAGDMAVLKGMRVGLITNHTGKTLDGRSTIDALHADSRIKLVALFAPEHGIRGAAEGGVTIDTDRDAKTGLPIYSLYGKTNRPTPEMLANIDALVFDIQDIGARYYTYPWTMALAMKAAAEEHKRFVVLDRPDPIGGDLVQGNVNDTLTFVGLYPVAMRHGLTVGELATMLNKHFGIGADLVVVKAEGWTRDRWYDQTGMPWTAPSPNMPTVESAAHYPGLCIFEGTNVSVGRGTPIAFQQIGAPWLDNAELLRRLNAYKFPGVRFEAVTFTPVKPGDDKYDGQAVKGVRLITTDRRRYDPTRVAMAALVEIHHLQQQEFKWGGTFDRLIGNSRVRRQVDAGVAYQEIIVDWDTQEAEFRRIRKPYLLY